MDELTSGNIFPLMPLFMKLFKKYAFAGTHIISPEVFKLMENWPEKFPIVDFYLQMADKYIIKGYVKNDLKMVDVGKLDSLEEAEKFLLCR